MDRKLQRHRAVSLQQQRFLVWIAVHCLAEKIHVHSLKILCTIYSKVTDDENEGLHTLTDSFNLVIFYKLEITTQK